ncbi:MAG: MFS transporter [Deltaproteobacteria bacterium]|nr:MFS transporter [Deltaproteobacteria bacterium]
MAKIFYGWWIVLATSLIHIWGAGTFYYGFTAFFNPIVTELGWSYAATSFAASLRSIEGGIASPLVGFATDRYGAKRLLVLGSVLGGVGFIFLSRIQTLWSFYLIFIFLSVGSSLLFPVPGWTAVANWFVKKRGMALGTLSATMGIAGMVIYLLNWLIGLYGWRQTLVIVGIGMWLIGIPSALVVRTRPEPYGLLPDGDDGAPLKQSRSTETPYQESQNQQEFTARAALRTRAFWIMALVVTISTGVLHAVVVHVMPYLISIHFSRETAGLTASLLILVSAMGRFILGSLTSRVDSRYLMTLALLLQALGLLALANARGLGQAALFVGLFGPGYGGVITLRLTMQAEYFGRKAFGAIQGIMMAILISGTMASPLVAGYCFDLYGTYRPAWLIMGLLLLLVTPLSILAKRPGNR